MSTWTIRQGDTRPTLRATLSTSAGPLDLTNAASVTWSMHKVSGAAVVVSGTCTIVDRAAGIIDFAPHSGQTDVPGDYAGTFQIVFQDAGVMTVPTSGSQSALIVASS